MSYATQAGDRALAQLAHDEAVAYYRQALELQAVAQGPMDESRRLELLISLGEAERRAGDPAHRQTLLQAAELACRREDVPALVRATLANTGLLPSILGRVDADRVAMLEAAIAAVGDQDPGARARLLATLGVELAFAGDWRRCLALSDEALDLARSLDDAHILARVLLARYFPTSVPELLGERLANTAELLRVVDADPDPALVAEAHLLRGRAALEAGDVEEADRCFDVADRLSAGLGQPAATPSRPSASRPPCGHMPHRRFRSAPLPRPRWLTISACWPPRSATTTRPSAASTRRWLSTKGSARPTGRPALAWSGLECSWPAVSREIPSGRSPSSTPRWGLTSRSGSAPGRGGPRKCSAGAHTPGAACPVASPNGRPKSCGWWPPGCRTRRSQPSWV